LPKRPSLFGKMSTADAYLLERANRVVYQHSELHAAVLDVILAMLVTRHGTLSPVYADIEPTLNQQRNILFILQLHLNHEANEHILPAVLDHVYRTNEPAIARLLRLLCKRLFDPEDYVLGDRIGGGSFGQVFKATSAYTRQPLAIKLTKVPQRVWDRCVLVDLFTEISAMEMFANDPRVSKLYVALSFSFFDVVSFIFVSVALLVHSV